MRPKDAFSGKNGSRYRVKFEELWARGTVSLKVEIGQPLISTLTTY